MSETPETSAVQHLSGIECVRVRTSRLETQLLTAGSDRGEPVMFLHGNFSAATIWEETLLALEAHCQGVAVDQRGYSGSDPEALIDATRGVADWADDALALADHLGWERFHVVAHSLGGCVTWSLLGSHADRLRTVTLLAPGPPCGFGGARNPQGELNFPDAAGSGAGLVQAELARRIAAGDRTVEDMMSPREVMNRLFWSPPFQPQRAEQLLTALLQIHVGEHQFPGDFTNSPNWPGFAPGRWGPINAISPGYNQHLLPQLLGARPKPPILWVYGSSDWIVSDYSASDPGYQGQLQLRPDWPGDALFPPQPLLTQVEWALDQYEREGGSVKRLVLPNVGHTPFMEAPDVVHAAVVRHVTEPGV